MASPQDYRDLRAEVEKLKSALPARDPIRLAYAPSGWGHPLDRQPVQHWMRSGEQHALEKFERLASAIATLVFSRPCGPEQWYDCLRESGVDIRSGFTITTVRNDVWDVETRAPLPEQTFVESVIDDGCAATVKALTLLATGTLGVPRGVAAAADGRGGNAGKKELLSADERRTAVTDMLDRVNGDTGEVFRLTDFWKAAKVYQHRKSFENWLKKGPEGSDSAHQVFCRVLLMSSTAFVAARSQWQKKPKRTRKKKNVTA